MPERYGSILLAADKKQHITRPLTENDLNRIHIPGNMNVADAPLTVHLTNWLYASDLHIPLHNRTYLERLIRVGKHAGIKHLVIGGDLFDFQSLSEHPKEDREVGYDDSKRVAGRILRLLGEDFHLYIVPGNHDRRYAKRLGGYIDFKDLIWAALAGERTKYPITVSNNDYIYINEGEAGWVVGHPRFFSTIPAKGGAEVAMIQRRNVCGAHNHIIGMMQSKCGNFWAVDPGHMTEPAMTPYKVRSEGLSKFPAWRPGFMLVQNNIPQIMTDGLVDWQAYGAE